MLDGLRIKYPKKAGYAHVFQLFKNVVQLEKKEACVRKVGRNGLPYL